MNSKSEIVEDIRNSTIRDSEQANADPSLSYQQNRPNDSLPVLNNQDKLLVRLKNFFEPYPQFMVRAQTKLDQEWPVRISIGKTSTKNPAQSKKFIVEVITSILSDVKSQWKDGVILSLAKKYAKTHLDPKFDEEEFFRQSKEFTKLQSLEATIRKKENQNKEELAQSISKNDLCGLWKDIRNEYFPERQDLDEYKVVWSGRKQTSSLASCNVARKRILVAPAMRTAESLPYLEPLLYHEMCHAYLGEPPIVNGRRVMHGKDFKALERKHPAIPELDKWIKSGGWHKVANSDEEVETN